LPVIRDKTSLYFGKLPEKIRKPFKKHSFYLVASLVVILFVVLVFGSKATLKSLSIRDFSFLAASVSDTSSQNLFAQPPENFVNGSPEMTVIQNNSLVGISPPITIKPQVLGSILGGTESRTKERGGVTEYSVKAGDSLSSIAANFNISIETILWANDLTRRSVIKPGQKLVILPVSGAFHLVKKGDTISEISEAYKGKTEEIIALNNLSGEGDIFIGDILVIPGGEKPSKVSHIASVSSSASADFYMFPCEGVITQGLHYYNAIDVANKCGSPIVAASGGTVQRAGWGFKVEGQRVTIQHSNGVVTFYGHLSRIIVAPGQTVNRGDIIGYMGETGHATGCHLHFDVRGATNFLSRYSLGDYISWKN